MIFYIKAFFLIIHLLLKKGYEPAWLYHYDLSQRDANGSEIEGYAITGGLKEFARCIVEEIHLTLYFKQYHFGETWYYRNEFYDNYKKQKMLHCKHQEGIS